MEQLQAFWDMLCGPWGPVVGALLCLVTQRLGISLPFKLPNIVPSPTPGPAVPSPLPVLIPNPDGTPKFPLLRQLLDAALKLSGQPLLADLTDMPAAQVKALRAELDALAQAKADKHKAEALEIGS